MSNSLDKLQKSAVAELVAFQTGPENEKTDHLRTVARLVVEARPHFYTKEGEPDWLGRTFAYRQWSRELMSLAGVPAGQISTIQAAIRYHTGTALREILGPDQLEALGLRQETPKERSALKRDEYNATLSIFSGGGRELTDVDEIRSALRTIELVLRRIVVPTSPKRDADAVRAAAEAVYTAVEALAATAGVTK